MIWDTWPITNTGMADIGIEQDAGHNDTIECECWQRNNGNYCGVLTTKQREFQRLGKGLNVRKEACVRDVPKTNILKQNKQLNLNQKLVVSEAISFITSVELEIGRYITTDLYYRSEVFENYGIYLDVSYKSTGIKCKDMIIAMIQLVYTIYTSKTICTLHSNQTIWLVLYT